MPKNRKSTNAEIERRVTVIYELLVKGWSRAQIQQYVSKRTHLEVLESPDPETWDPNTEPSWDVDQRTIDMYMARAREKFKEKANNIREEVLGRTLERREDLYQQSREHMDLKTALAVDQDTARLLDLYPEQKSRVTHEEVNPYAKLPVIQLAALLDELDRVVLSERLIEAKEPLTLEALTVEK